MDSHCFSRNTSQRGVQLRLRAFDNPSTAISYYIDTSDFDDLSRRCQARRFNINDTKYRHGAPPRTVQSLYGYG